MKIDRRLTVLAVVLIALVPYGARARSSQPPSPVPPLGYLVPLSGSTIPHLSLARRLAPLAPSTRLSIAVSLRVRDQAALQQYLRALYTPGSPDYHHFLTPRRFATRFAASPREQQRVIGWLHARGLTVVRRSPGGLLVDAVGPAGRVEAAFGTRIATYRQGHLSFFANTAPIRVPQGLASTILAVSGLDNRLQLRPAGRPVFRSHIRARDNGPGGAQPADLATFYDVKPLYDQGLDGSGQTIAIVAVTNFSDSNIATYTSQFGLPAASIERVPVSDGSKTGGGAINPAEQGEAEMDLEVAHASAPGAKILYYMGPGTGGLSLLSVYEHAVSDDRAPVISSSYGLAESELDQQFVGAIDAMMEEAAAQGQSVLAASGDDGAYDASKVKGSAHQSDLVVDFPASDPWVTGVGGTMVNQNADGSLSQVAWSDQTDKSGSGGGLSMLFKRPSYQTGPGVDNQYSNGMRQVPDVSALAGAPGYTLYTGGTDGTGWSAPGGTSAATPFWAGYIALIDQYGKASIGFLNPTLYALGQKASTFQTPPFADITDGDNLYYPATPGWDYATGWGPMDGVNLINDLVTMGGPLEVHPVDWTMTAQVAQHTNGKYKRLTQIKRGQSISLRLLYTLLALPAPATATADVTLAGASSTIFHKTATFPVDKSALWTTKAQVYTLKVPKKAPSGAYTLTIKVTIGDTSQQATAQVTLK